MKIVISFIIVIAICWLLSGCGVWMNAQYSQLLDQTAALSADTADRANQGLLTPEQMTSALNGQSQVWQQFRNARDGKE